MDLQPLESAHYYWTRSPPSRPPPPPTMRSFPAFLVLVDQTRREGTGIFSKIKTSLPRRDNTSRGETFFFLFFRFHSSLEPATFDELAPAPR